MDEMINNNENFSKNKNKGEIDNKTSNNAHNAYNDLSKEQFNYRYEKFLMSIDKYVKRQYSNFSCDEFRKADLNNSFSKEQIEKIKACFEKNQNKYLKLVDEETEKFVLKYNLVDEFRVKSEKLIYENLIKELKIEVDDLNEIDVMREMDDMAIMTKYFPSKCVKKNMETISKENEELRKKLEQLKKENNLGIK